MRKNKEDRCPQEVAAAVLETICRDRSVFDMGTWALMEGTAQLHPWDNPSDCGTTLCAAGLAAHEGGWTIVRKRYGTPRAVKDGRELPIPEAAEEALGLTYEQGRMIWYECEEAAYDFLKEIAATGGLLI